jgi:hypothetical protein
MTSGIVSPKMLQTGWIRRAFLDLDAAKGENNVRTILNSPDWPGFSASRVTSKNAFGTLL